MPLLQVTPLSRIFGSKMKMMAPQDPQSSTFWIHEDDQRHGSKEDSKAKNETRWKRRETKRKEESQEEWA